MHLFMLKNWFLLKLQSLVMDNIIVVLNNHVCFSPRYPFDIQIDNSKNKIGKNTIRIT